ncbi:hypothetical protein BAE44_0016964, partial [Dichanthelium oligosanthes]
LRRSRLCRRRCEAIARRPGREPRRGGSGDGNGDGLQGPAGEGVVEGDGHGVDAATPLRSEHQGSGSLARAMRYGVSSIQRLRPAEELPLYDGFSPMVRTFGRSS